MKLLNIFKKESKQITQSNIQRLEKSQLDKIIGGGDGSETPDAVTAVTEPKKKGLNAINVS